MNNLYNVLQQHISENQPSLDDRESVLNLLYETYSECYRIDDPLTKSDFEELSRQANDLTLKEMNQIIYSVSTLCRDHKQSWIHRRNLGWCFAQRIIAPVMHMHHDRQQVCPKPYMSVVYLLSTCDTISTISCPYSVICASSKHLKDTVKEILEHYLDMDRNGTFLPLLNDAIEFFETICEKES